MARLYRETHGYENSIPQEVYTHTNYTEKPRVAMKWILDGYEVHFIEIIEWELASATINGEELPEEQDEG